MKRLANELSRVPCIRYLDSIELSDGLISGDIRQCILVACSDMGANLPYVCSVMDVNLLLFQNFGHSTSMSNIDALLFESASDLVVYGHTDCMFLRLLALPDKESEERQILLRKHFQFESELLIHQYRSQSGCDEHTVWKRLSEWRVMRELQLVLANPQIRDRFEAGQLDLHGWVHDVEENVLEVFDPEKQAFVLERAAKLDFKFG